MSLKIYTTLTPGDDTGEQSSKIAAGLFSNGSGELTTFYTSSTQVAANGMYAINCYNASTSSTTSEVQFSISYGDRNGSGSLETNDNKSTRAIYSQYRNLLLDQGVTQFTFGPSVNFQNSVASDHIVVLNFKRSQFKENIDPGNWQLTLGSGSTYIKLTDSSLESLGAGTPSGISPSGKVYYDIVSGTIADGPLGTVGNYKYYGLLYSDLGIMVLNADVLNVSMSLNASSGSGFDTSATTPDPNNNTRMFNLINGGASFKARNEETLNSQYYFIRIKSKEYNLSNNPTYVSGSYGKIIDPIIKRGIPFSYVTGIGLYDNSNNLLATAKLSQPLFKEPGVEALIRIRLDFVWFMTFVPLAYTLFNSLFS